MSFIGSIGRFASGDWQGGLAQLLGGSIGAQIADTAMGRQSIGEMAGNMGKEAAISIPTTIATAGLGAAAGAAASGLAKVASAGAQAGKAATIGTKIASGASNVLSGVAKVASNNSISSAMNNASGSGVMGAIKGVAGISTGGASSLEGASTSMTSGIASGATEGVKGTLPNLGVADAKLASTAPAGAPALRPAAQISGTTGSSAINNLKANLPATGQSASQMFAGTSKGVIVQTPQNAAKGLLNTAKGKVSIGGIAQLGLSALSTVQGAKQANASNQISQQSLLFQQQQYNEAKAEKESYKAGMKQTAQTAYESSQLFGANLYGSDSNSTLLTSNTNGTGNEGNYSILSWSSKSKT